MSSTMYNLLPFHKPLDNIITSTLYSPPHCDCERSVQSPYSHTPVSSPQHPPHSTLALHLSHVTYPQYHQTNLMSRVVKLHSLPFDSMPIISTYAMPLDH